MISPFIAQVFCALKSYVHFFFFAAPGAVVSVFGAEKKIIAAKPETRAPPWFSMNVLIN